MAIGSVDKFIDGSLVGGAVLSESTIVVVVSVGRSGGMGNDGIGRVKINNMVGGGANIMVDGVAVVVGAIW